MRERWATKVKRECEQAGFTFKKDSQGIRWQMLDGGKVLKQSTSLGDILRFAGNTLEIPV